ncbi:sensor domain-containing protein [Kribbella sp. NBC_01510]|uniref:sensor domain-containing protein n=1 Tax=Kribbella sp. NBC_01510 TaxID=2903581 RepID=UPI003863F0C7
MQHVELYRIAEAAHRDDHETVPQGTDAEPRQGRIKAWTRAALRDVLYCGAVFAWSIACFTILVTGAAVTASLLFLIVGVFVWLGFVHVLRWTTWVDRRLAGWQRHERVPAAYRRPTDRGFIPYLQTLSSDPQTWKDMAWLGVTSIVGFAGGLAVITAAGLAATYMSMPLWYWAASHPHRKYGITNLGFLTVDTLGKAGIAAAIGLLLIPVVLLLARWCAATHAGLAVRLLARDATP